MSEQIPKTMKAFVIDDGGGKASVKEVAVPTLEANDVLIKIAYVSQNPTDWKHVETWGQPKGIAGCDYSGTVVALGSNLTTPLKVGDKVAGAVHGGLYPDKGSFAEYARAESDLTFKIPDNLTLEEASNFGVPWLTTLQVIFDSQKHEFPPATVPEGKWYLVYGASSSVGLFAVQVAKIIGYKVIAVCSPHNFDLVKSYGADETVDYHDAEKAKSEIKRISGGGVDIGLDTISEGNSFDISVGGYGSKGGRLNAILPPSEAAHKIRSDVEIVPTLMYTILGKPFKAWAEFPAIPEDRKAGAEFFARSADIIAKYNVKANPLQRQGGLNDIQSGFDHMKAGKVSAKKLVYKVAESS